MVEPQRSIVRFDEASLGRDEPKTNRTGGKAREKPHCHPSGEVLLDNADAVIDALRLLPGGDALRKPAEIRRREQGRGWRGWAHAPFVARLYIFCKNCMT